jgi:hypothetical protein
MDRLRDQDLAVHLYNAHAMKQRHYDLNVAPNIKSWTSKVSLQLATPSFERADL